MPLSSTAPIPLASEALTEDRVYAKVTRRLIPFIFLSYVVSYLDRVNVGFAKLQMLSDLQFSEAVYGLGAGIFFLGYFIFEVPSNIILQKVGARRWISRIMVTWGIVSACSMFITTPTTFYIFRFVLGIAEAGFFPGVILYLTYWYPSHRRGRVMGMISSAIPISGLFGGPLSGWIMQVFGGIHGLKSWQWLFLLEGIPSIIVGVIALYYLDDGIKNAKWLTEDEKEFLSVRIEKDASEKQHHSIKSVFTNPQVFLMGAIDFSFIMGLYGVSFWLPTIIKASGVSEPLDIGVLTALPYAVAVVMMIFVTRHADKQKERRWHLVFPAILGGIGLIATATLSHSVELSMLALTIATAGIITTLPLFWSLPTALLGGAGAAAGIAIVNCVGNLAGFFSPILVGFIKDVTHSTDLGMYLLAGMMFVGAALVLRVPAQVVNR
ncbi:MFS transporter (plasmid) [Cupriavidus pinatubonensis]|nr:MFS transporter [Cupriavidus pinatubonensis]